MTSEKLEALEELIQEQSEAGHIEEFASPWNSPICYKKEFSSFSPPPMLSISEEILSLSPSLGNHVCQS
ncbi:putative Pol polyprotein [Cricetulus griseus]|uniref:Putative Pol polyprotein n=1 Tax=Cricetulus griseus TaxID=10029 RepID=A0A061IQL2_CRIGR|nr:putative Pol polyprotein [Cricetulus griseus]